MEKDLFYRPHVEPTRDYHSDGIIPHENVTNTSTPEPLNRPYTRAEETYTRNINTADKLLRIRAVLPLLPEKVVPIITQIVDYMIGKIWLDNIGPISTAILEEGGYPGITTPPPESTEETIPPITAFVDDYPSYHPPAANETKVSAELETYKIPTSGDPDEDDDYEWPEMESSGFEIEVEENKNIWEMAQDQYMEDSSHMKEMFALSYNEILEGYIYQLMTAMDEAGVDSPESLNLKYEGETVTGISENDQHLNDIIVRNQEIINDMSDLFQLTHDLYTTQEVMGAFDAIAQERVRYLKERYKEASAQSYLEMYDKNLLAASRDQYDARYIYARTEAYKFLNSASALSGDMLQHALAANLAKCSLLKKGINIFAKKEYENETYSNGTVEKEQKNKDAKKEEAKDKQEEKEKVTDTKASEQKKKADVDLDTLMVGGGIGGAVKNVKEKTKQTAKETTKTTNSSGTVKIETAAAQINTNKTKDEKPQGA